MDYLGENIETNGIDSISTSGFSPLYIGFKIKILDEDGWMPSIAFLGAIVTPFTASDYFKTTYTASNMRFAFAHTLYDRVSLGYNLGVELDGETAIPSYFYTLSVGIGIFDRTGVYIESYGTLVEKGEQEHLVDAGLTYLVLPNLQFDASGGIGIQNAIDYYISFGLSYRIPN